MKIPRIVVAAVACVALTVGALAYARAREGAIVRVPAPAVDIPATSGPQTAVLAGGCFWGMEGVFERLKGVSSVVSGFAGGSQATAHYEMVSTGTTGHAESVEITFDPHVITYGQLLEVFFSVAHDPTELNFQGPDEGTQYRSSIFYVTAEQKAVADAYIRQLTAARVFPRRIVTTVVPLAASGFYPAEGYHQHFLDRNPTYPYIVYNDLPKIAALRKAFPELVNAAYTPARN
jgi:peptide-methionine (S)-S-oxide reductase